MSNITVSRRIAIIHAIKCKKTESDLVADESYSKQANFQGKIREGVTDLPALHSEINRWAESSPIVTEKDIDEILNK
jgi:hypothetical protein